MANDGTDNGAPGERVYHPGYYAAFYAAFVLDPDGNNIEAVYHGEAKRSPPPCPPKNVLAMLTALSGVAPAQMLYTSWNAN